jgi:hypothetical protein
MAEKILSLLAPLLSPEASIALHDNADFAKLIDRWRVWHAPEVTAVVQVATEADVQQTVSCSKHAYRIIINAVPRSR